MFTVDLGNVRCKNICNIIITLKLTMSECLKKHYVRAKFHPWVIFHPNSCNSCTCNWHCSVKVELVQGSYLTAEAVGASAVLPTFFLVWYHNVIIRKWGFWVPETSYSTPCLLLSVKEGWYWVGYILFVSFFFVDLTWKDPPQFLFCTYLASKKRLWSFVYSVTWYSQSLISL